MVFSSILFLLYFLPIFLLCYWLTPRNFKNYIILVFSLIFYSWGAPEFVFILVGSTILDFFIVKGIERSITKKRKKGFLIASLGMNIGLLAYFKYANFFVENFNTALRSLGVEQVEWTEVVLPIGISFYTFQTLTYAIDVYRGVHKSLHKLTDYLVYILSFPQMIAGPIVRFNLIADEIVLRKETIDDKIYGFYRFCIGLAKKVFIANVMGEVASGIMDHEIDGISTTTAWIGILAYTFQIYFDFAGYSDMAIGLGRMMGFHFPENFNNPYTSRSITEFWRRWHITLGQWMRDYLYIPLGGNRVSKKWRIYFNLWIVFLISGLWHGASWNFVIWGAFHGLFLILDRLFLQKVLDSLGRFASVIITFTIVVFGWVFFKIEDFDTAILYCSKMIDFTNWHSLSLDRETLFVGSLAIFFSFITSFSIGKKIETFLYAERISNTGVSLQIVSALIVFVLSVSIITASDFNPFIYYRF